MIRLQLLSVVLLAFVLSSHAQTIEHVFPEEDALVTQDDLLTRGFEWNAFPGATEYQLTVLSLDVLQPQPFEPVTGIAETSVQLTEVQVNAMRPDRYFWQITVTAGEGAGTTSEFLPFDLLEPGFDLIPTPTPVGPLPFPGDFDNSERVTAIDLLMIAQRWKQVTDTTNSGYDLNNDGEINAPDLLRLVRRIGTTEPIFDPESPVGPIQSLTFSPDSTIPTNQMQFFELDWEAPAYPVGDTFTYDVLLDSQSGFRSFFEDVAETRIRPFPNGLTLTGVYQVYIRATNSEGIEGTILVSSFEIVLSGGGIIPTPTPGINPELPAPTWVEAVIDPDLLNDPLLGPSPCAPEISPLTIPFNGLFLFTFPTYSNQCQISGIRATQFYYENLEDANGYEIVMVEPSGNALTFVVNSYQPIQFNRFTPGVYQLNVRARFAGNQTGAWSPTLQVTIPTSGG